MVNHIDRTDDMLAILFPHMFFPEEYMEEDVIQELDGMAIDPIEEEQPSDIPGPSTIRRAVTNSNAQAGPSRLR
jgi:hypothetical protein